MRSIASVWVVAAHAAECPDQPVDTTASQCLDAEEAKEYRVAELLCDCWMRGDPLATRPIYILAGVKHALSASVHDTPEEEDLLLSAKDLYLKYLDRDPNDQVRRASARERLEQIQQRLDEIAAHRVATTPPPAAPPPPAAEPYVAPNPEPPSRHRWSFVALGAAVGLAGGALATALWTKSSYGDLSQDCAGSAEGCSQSDIDSVESKALVTNILLAAAGAAAGTSAVLFMLESREPSKSVTVSAAPGGLVVTY